MSNNTSNTTERLEIFIDKLSSILLEILIEEGEEELAEAS